MHASQTPTTHGSLDTTATRSSAAEQQRRNLIQDIQVRHSEHTRANQTSTTHGSLTLNSNTWESGTQQQRGNQTPYTHKSHTTCTCEPNTYTNTQGSDAYSNPRESGTQQLATQK